VLAIGALDYLTGSSLSFSFLYLISVAVAIVLGGRIAGVICSLAASGIVFLDQFRQPTPDYISIAIWNAGMMLCTLLLATFIIYRLWETFQNNWETSQDDYVSRKPQPASPNTAAKKTLGTIFLVYFPFVLIVYLNNLILCKNHSHDIGFSFFYLLPLIMAVILTGRIGGFVYAFIASLAFMILLLLHDATILESMWNALMRLLVLLTIAQVIWLTANTKAKSFQSGTSGPPSV
jgi:K+-sensing histidine kinase KdpD